MANQAGSYAELCRNFRWQVPEHFNIGVDVCGRWAEDRSRFALYYDCLLYTSPSPRD